MYLLQKIPAFCLPVCQVALLRELLDAEHSNGRTWGADKVEVSTVDGFQGREKGCIVFSAVKKRIRTDQKP